ncbi:unnamed protein product, partial [marine sediment metagenome]
RYIKFFFMTGFTYLSKRLSRNFPHNENMQGVIKYFLVLPYINK